MFLQLPAVITTDLRLNEPRYISLPNIVQAKKKQIAVMPAESFGIDLTPRVNMLKAAIPEKKRAGVRVETAADLVNIFKKEAQVI